jgi:hypothetical protein
MPPAVGRERRAVLDHHERRIVRCAVRARSHLMKRRVLVAVVTLLMLLGAWSSRGAAQASRLNGFDVSDAIVPTEAIERGGPPRDGIPAIDRPRFVAAAKSGLSDDDRVLGLVRAGVARAYPVKILNWHEVVNDRVGGEPLAITYCPLCGTGMAFEARVAGREASFGVSGLLYNSDVLLYDRGTESLWSQIMARAISGPLKGAVLTMVPLTHTSWADWRARHPASEVLSTETGFARDYGRDPYAGYDKVPRLMFDVQHRDERVPVKEWVLGLRVGGEAKAYPFSTLDRLADGEGLLRDRVGGQAVQIRFDRTHRSAEAFDAAGQPLPAVMAYWFAWVAFYPHTDLLMER